MEWYYNSGATKYVSFQAVMLVLVLLIIAWYAWGGSLNLGSAPSFQGMAPKYATPSSIHSTHLTGLGQHGFSYHEPPVFYHTNKEVQDNLNVEYSSMDLSATAGKLTR